MNCFLFSGQPLVPPPALPQDADGAQITELVRRIAHLDLESGEWLDSQGSEQVKLQLGGVAHSLYRHRALLRVGVRPDLVAEHSMGIYPALAACASLGEAEAIEIAFRVGGVLWEMARSGPYAVGCVIGLELDAVLGVAANHHVHLANHNTSRHFLLSGREEQIDEAMREALAAGAFSVRCLPYDAPIHTPLMAALEPQLQAVFQEYRFADPLCPLVEHIEQKCLKGREIGGFLLRELSLPVFWERTYRTLRSFGVKGFLEVGAGESLKKFNRWIDGEAPLRASHGSGEEACQPRTSTATRGSQGASRPPVVPR